MKKQLKTVSLLLAIVFLLSALPGTVIAAAGGLVNILVQPTLVFERVYAFSDGLAMVVTKDQKVGYVDKTGKYVIQPIYDAGGEYFTEGLVQVATGNWEDGYKYGYIDKTGKVVIPLKYAQAEAFDDGLALVAEGNWDDGFKYGFINKTGAVVVPLEYDYAGNWFYDDMVRVAKSDAEGRYKYGFINKSGGVVIPLQYDSIGYFYDGLATVYQYDESTYLYKVGFINKSNTLVIPMDYSGADSFNNGIAVVSKYGDDGSKYGAIDTTGKVVVPLVYDYMYGFSEGLAAVYNYDDNWNTKYGYVDTTGKIVIPMEYDDADSFYDGMARVRKGDWSTGKYGVIGKDGKAIIPLEYEMIGWGLYDDLIAAKKDGKWGYINKANKLVIPHMFSYAYSFYNGMAEVSKGSWEAGGEKWGIIDTTGRNILPFDYNYAYTMGNGLISVQTYNEAEGYKTGLADISGKIVLPVEYNQMIGAYSGPGWIGVGSWEKGFTWGIIEVTPSYEAYDPKALDEPSSWFQEWLDEALEYGILPADMQIGYQRNITRAEFCALAVALIEKATGKTITERGSFADDEGDINIQKIGGLTIVSGTDAAKNLFSPDQGLKRYEAALILDRIARREGAFNKPLPEGTAAFTDIQNLPEGWVAAINRMRGVSPGIMSGKEGGIFDPYGSYTTEEAITTMVKLYRHYIA
ncbi:MAG: WG repeat-containing protein [Oscillospiraceae bacterium]|nr:WG repeat-containing protein [Oscillospiraceae bacterium]